MFGPYDMAINRLGRIIVYDYYLKRKKKEIKNVSFAEISITLSDRDVRSHNTYEELGDCRVRMSFYLWLLRLTDGGRR